MHKLAIFVLGLLAACASGGTAERAGRDAAAAPPAPAPQQAALREAFLASRFGTWNVAFEAFAELVVLDFAYERCVRAPLDTGNPYRLDPSRAMRACFHATVLPGDCRQYFGSVERAAELAAVDPGVAPLATAAAIFLSVCGEGAPPRAPPDAARTESRLTIIEHRLGRTAPADPPRFANARLPPAGVYLADLCPQIHESALQDFRISELLLCSDPSDPGGVTDHFRALIRARLAL